MGKHAKHMIGQLTASTTVQVVHDMMQNAQLLGGLATVLIDEQQTDLANPNQLVEAAVRCIETVELIVHACEPTDVQLKDWEKSSLNRDLRKIRKKLDKIKASILEIPPTADK